MVLGLSFVFGSSEVSLREFPKQIFMTTVIKITSLYKYDYVPFYYAGAFRNYGKGGTALCSGANGMPNMTRQIP